MKCSEIQPELLPYHFGEIDGTIRRELEQHLLSCQHCLGDFLAIKREVETAGTAAAPSPDARLRLRAAVAQQVRPEVVREKWSWWERPVALLFAGAAVAAALFIVQLIATGPGTMPHSLSRQDPPAAIQLR